MRRQPGSTKLPQVQLLAEFAWLRQTERFGVDKRICLSASSNQAK
jgi:hypothetical protein